jgi:DNA-binding NarL/FixJ family response regulator
VIRALVADDQEVVRAGFSALLDTQSDITVVASAADGAEAARLSSEHRPDVVLMDVRMPVMDGIEATRQICAGDDGDGPRILILTTFDLDEYVYDALHSGASGFLLKDAPAETLFEAVRVIAAGEALLAPAITRRLIAEFARLRHASRLDPTGFRCSRRVRPRSWDSSPKVSPTARLPAGSCSATRPSRPTSATSCGSSGSVTGRKPW